MRCGFRRAFSRASEPAAPPNLVGREERDAQEDQKCSDAHREQDALRSEPVHEEPVDEQREPDRREQRRADRPVFREPPRRELRALAYGRDRWHARGAEGGAEARKDGHENPDDEGDDHRPRVQDEPVVRQREADRVEELEEADAEPEPDGDPGDRGDRADRQALPDDRPPHLASRRSERSQGRELARPLGDRDRERVRNHERAHEERDPAEREQEVLQEVEEALGVLRVRLGLRLTRPHLRVRGQDAADLRRELRRRHARLRLRANLVELPDALEEPLRGRQVEARERRAAEARRAAEVDEPGDGHPQRRPVRLHADRAADQQILLVRGRLVDHDLVRPWPFPFDERQRVERRPLGVDAETEVRCAPEVDDLAVENEVRVASDPANGIGDVGQLADLREQRLAERRGRRPVVAQVERRLPAHRCVGALVDLREDPAERALDRVGEHVGARDERDAEDDRDRGQCCAQLAPRHASQRDADHELSEFITASTSCWLAPRSSFTIRPSSRKRIRSAIEAARASCVTITVVWP